MKTVCIIQSSLRTESYTDILCNFFIKECSKRKDIQVKKIDLRKRELEWCRSNDIHEYSNELQKDHDVLKQADATIFGFPIYHYAISGVLKNYIDIMGDALSHKRIDFLVTALMRDCDIAYKHILESLIHKFNVEKISKETVYVLDRDFEGGEITNLFERNKITDLIQEI